MRQSAWSAKVGEELGWYVYALRDPRDGDIFYIGKGKGDRCFQHAEQALGESAETDPLGAVVSQKIDRIRQIHESTGGAPEVLILRHQIPSEASAYAVEAALLDFCRLLAKSRGADFVGPGFSLTNVMGGWDSSRLGLMTPHALESLYSAEPLAREEITVPAILFKIPRKWTADMTADEIFAATRGWWKLKDGPGSQKESAKFALAVSNGIIRGIYTITPGTWRNDVETPDRWGFSGEPATGEVTRFLNRDVSSWTKGVQSPFMYLNCDKDARKKPPAAHQELSYQVKELLSWMTAAHLLRVIDAPLRVFITHPGDGSYDCLTLVKESGEEVIALNRNGDSALIAGDVISGIWEAASLSPGAGPRGLAEQLATASGLPLALERDPGATALAATWIANWLNLNRDWGTEVHALPVLQCDPHLGDQEAGHLLEPFTGVDTWVAQPPPLEGLTGSAWLYALSRGGSLAALVNTATGEFTTRVLRRDGTYRPSTGRVPTPYLDESGKPSCPVAIHVVGLDRQGAIIYDAFEELHFASRHVRQLEQHYHGAEFRQEPVFDVPPRFLWVVPQPSTPSPKPNAESELHSRPAGQSIDPRS